MKIDTSKIENYENMTAEEKVAYYEAFEYDDKADELAKYKNAVSKANSEAAEYKRKARELEQKKLESLSEEERLKAETENKINDLNAELETLRKEKTIASYQAQYIALGYSPELAKDTAEAICNNDMVKVLANQKIFNDGIKAQVQSEILKSQPSPTTGAVVDNEKSQLNIIRANMGLPPI